LEDSTLKRRDFVNAAALGALGALASSQNQRASCEPLEDSGGAEASPAAPKEKNIELHIYLEPFAGKGDDLEAAYWQHFVPAIEVQKGFQRTVLLRKRDAVREYQINIAFTSEDLRLEWVASREHAEAWPKLEALCQRASWEGFDVISGRR
jgi:heme-degrading monooxygenase HmoA